MEKMSYSKALKFGGFTYLGSVAQSAKTNMSKKNGTYTYCIYLAPSTMSGYNTCPNAEHCKANCLSGSGRAKLETLSKGFEESKINQARIKKTKLLFEHKDIFMLLMIHEIEYWQKRAEKDGYNFSVRINGTSDLSPLKFKDENGKNILEIFPNVQFYDYTKVPTRHKLVEQYKNYYLVLSYNGYNDEECKEWLAKGGNVAVVFFGDKLPKKFMGYNVCDGNNFDMRYLDPQNSVVGLHYHKTANDYKVINGKRTFVTPNTPFVVMENDERIEW